MRREVHDRPQDPVLLTEFATQLVAEGQTEAARRLCHRAVAVAPGHSELYQAHLMLARLGWGDCPEQACHEAETALRSRPDLPECWIERLGPMPCGETSLVCENCALRARPCFLWTPSWGKWKLKFFHKVAIILGKDWVGRGGPAGWH